MTDQTQEGATSVSDNAMDERALAPEIPVIVFANEFFDALPVEILSQQGALRISTKNGRFIETWAPSSAEELEFLYRYGVHPEAEERIEAPLLANRYMARLAASVRTGIIIAVDYGYTRPEQLAGRHRGTLMAFRQHSATPNPYQAPGEQDLTAHLNFTALSAAAEQNGMQVQPLLTQSQFLMGIGESNQFADAFEDCRLPQERTILFLGIGDDAGQRSSALSLIAETERGLMSRPVFTALAMRRLPEDLAGGLRMSFIEAIGLFSSRSLKQK